MITSKFNPGLQVLDAIRRSHPAALGQTLETLIRHLTGCPNFMRPEAIIEACNAFLRDDMRARTEPLRLRLFGKTEIIIDADDGALRLIDGTSDHRFTGLWLALTDNPTGQPQEGGDIGEAKADDDSAD